MEALRTRSPARGAHGAAATSHPAATLAAIDVLQGGGNAIDAAVTAALVLGVVEPMSVGIGGDAFVLLWSAREGRLVGHAGNGASPAGLTPEILARHGTDRVPARGPLSITVPGAIDAFDAVLGRFGRRTLAQCLGPAIRAASDGFAATDVVAASWARLAAHAGGLPPPRPGEIVRSPALAASLGRIAEGGRDEYYRGGLGREIAAGVQAAGGVLEAADLAAHEGAWVTPVEVPYRGVRVVELPPPGQGVTALLALRLLERFTLFGRAWDDPLAWHLRIEAVKRAMTERDAHLADPRSMRLSVQDLLSDEAVTTVGGAIDPFHAARTQRPLLPSGGTVILATADGEGNLVSFISSLFDGFGSGVVAGQTGILLQNRAHGFAPAGDHPNAVGPCKKPLHTIIPAMLLDREGAPRAAFGLMGGDMQAQGHVQLVSHVVDHGLDWQQAIDAPRFRWMERADVVLEDRVPDSIRDALAIRGHLVRRERGVFGGGQAVARSADGTWVAASDPRKDGCALAY